VSCFLDRCQWWIYFYLKLVQITSFYNNLMLFLLSHPLNSSEFVPSCPIYLSLPKSVFALVLNVALRKDLSHCAVVLDSLVSKSEIPHRSKYDKSSQNIYYKGNWVYVCIYHTCQCDSSGNCLIAFSTSFDL